MELAGPGSGALPESGNLTLCVRPERMILLLLGGKGGGGGARVVIFLFSLSTHFWGPKTGHFWAGRHCPVFCPKIWVFGEQERAKMCVGARGAVGKWISGHTFGSPDLGSGWRNLWEKGPGQTSL